MSYRVLLYSNWEDDNDVFLTFRRTIELPFPPFAGLTLWFRVTGRDEDSSVEIKDVNWSMYEREFQCNLLAVQKIWFRDMTPKEMIKAVREEEHDLGFKEISVEVIGPTKKVKKR